MNYVKIWEKYNNSILPENMEIHHIDGDHNNNDPNNLLAVTIQEHLQIHLQQNDYGATQAILMRMDRTDEDILLMKECASKNQKELWKKGIHNFQNISSEDFSEIRRNVGYYTRDNLLGIHKINADPILCKENARRGGLTAASKKSGFLNTSSDIHGSNFVKETKWWVNKEGKRRRSKDKPSNDYIEGMKYES